MYLKQIIIIFVTDFIISAQHITSGFEIISTTTERDGNKDNRCQQEIVKILGNNLELFEKKLEEVNAEFEKKQKELLEIVNKKLENVQEVLKKIEKITSNPGKVESRKKSLPRNCLEILEEDATLSDGVYTIKPSRHSPSFEVRCDMHTRDGGWTYVLSRFNGSQDFYMGWQHYKNGFGNLSGEFWLGLQHLYELTGFHDNQLLIEIVDWDNKQFYAMYDVFRIGSAEDGYLIKGLDGYSGDAGDSLIYHKTMKFSTYDRDQDQNPKNCATTNHGAWWYNSCHHSNLAGTYFNTAQNDTKGMVWYHLKNRYTSLKRVKMMVRPYYLY